MAISEMKSGEAHENGRSRSTAPTPSPALFYRWRKIDPATEVTLPRKHSVQSQTTNREGDMQMQQHPYEQRSIRSREPLKYIRTCSSRETTKLG